MTKDIYERARAFDPVLVYLLWHVRADDQHANDAKLIGVYRSRESAEAAVFRVKGQPGFRDHPEGFEISAYSLDKDHWTEGFVAVRYDEEDRAPFHPLQTFEHGVVTVLKCCW